MYEKDEKKLSTWLSKWLRETLQFTRDKWSLRKKKKYRGKRLKVTEREQMKLRVSLNVLLVFGFAREQSHTSSLWNGFLFRYARMNWDSSHSYLLDITTCLPFYPKTRRAIQQLISLLMTRSVLNDTSSPGNLVPRAGGRRGWLPGEAVQPPMFSWLIAVCICLSRRRLPPYYGYTVWDAITPRVIDDINGDHVCD